MLRQGISSIVPVRLLPMFTWQELEHLICGVADVDVEMLQNQTKYVGGVSQTDAHITFFWDVIANEFTPEDRTQFLKFVWVCIHVAIKLRINVCPPSILIMRFVI